MSEFPLIGTPAALDGRPSQPPQRPHLQTQSHSRVQGVRAATQELRKDTTHLKTLYLLDPVIHAFSHTKHIHSHPSSPKVFLFRHILKNCCSRTVLHSRSPPPRGSPTAASHFMVQQYHLVATAGYYNIGRTQTVILSLIPQILRSTLQNKARLHRAHSRWFSIYSIHRNAQYWKNL